MFMALWPFLKALFVVLPALWQAARDRKLKVAGQREILAALFLQLNARVTAAQAARDEPERTDDMDRARSVAPSDKK